jgi:hypothetical protein
MAARAATTTLTESKTRVLPLPAPSAPLVLDIPKGLGPLAEIEFALRVGLGHWFADSKGESIVRWSNVETFSSPSDVTDFGTFVNVNWLDDERLPPVYLHFLQGFRAKGTIEVEANALRVCNSLARAELARVNALGGVLRRIVLEFVLDDDRLTVRALPEEVVEAEREGERLDAESIFAWAKSYKAEPTNVIQLPANLGGGAAYRARDLDATKPAEKAYTYSRATLPIMLEFAVRPVEFFFREIAAMMSELEINPCEQVYALDMVLRRAFGQHDDPEYPSIPSVTDESHLAEKATMLRDAGFVGLAAVLESEPALWDQMAMEGFIMFENCLTKTETLGFSFDKCVEVFRPCVTRRSIKTEEEVIGI